jgi:hypothetical protein
LRSRFRKSSSRKSPGSLEAALLLVEGRRRRWCVMARKPTCDREVRKMRAALTTVYTRIGEDLIEEDIHGAYTDREHRLRYEKLHRDLGRTLGIGKR